ERVTSAPVQPEPRDAPQAGIRFDLSQLSQEIASLEAQLAEERQQYAERPRVHRLNSASTRRDPGPFYMDSWRRSSERFGNQCGPAEACSPSTDGSLVLRVAIRRDGSLDSVEPIESSGHQVLDSAALRIVRRAAPFAPFPGDLAEFGLIEITRT